MTQINWTELKVGDIVHGVEASDGIPPHLRLGDFGNVNVDGRASCGYQVVRTYAHPMTGVIEKYDLLITKVYPKDVDYIVSAMPGYEHPL